MRTSGRRSARSSAAFGPGRQGLVAPGLATGGLPPLFFMANEVADTLAQEAADKAQLDLGTATAVEMIFVTARTIAERAAHTTIAAIAAEDAEKTTIKAGEVFFLRSALLRPRSAPRGQSLGRRSSRAPPTW